MQQYNEFNKIIKLQNRMDIAFMNSGTSKTRDPHRLLPNLSDKINSKGSAKYVALSNLSIYHKWKNIKKSYKNNKFKISAPTWNEEFPNGLFLISGIKDYFVYIIKQYEAVIDNSLVMMYVNKIDIELCLK